MSTVRENLFKYRSYAPIPFLVVMIIFAEPTVFSFALGAAVAALGEFVRFWGVAYAGPLTRVTGNVGAPELMVSGPFAYVRNPLYIGNILMYVGIGVMANALTPWLVIIAGFYFFFQYSLIVSLEEEFLQKEFGMLYADYKEHVPRFFPRSGRYVSPVQQHQHPDWKRGLRSEKRTFQAISLTAALVVVRWVWG